MQTSQSTMPYGRRTIMYCSGGGVGGTAAHLKILQKSACCSRLTRGQGISGPSASPPSNAIRDFLTPHIGIRALGGDNQCLPVFGTGKARAVTASLKLPIRFGEIFAVFRRRAEE